MDADFQPTGGETRSAAANAVTPDPETAELLAKRSAGEKLTPRQYGKLGAWAASLSRFFGKTGNQAESSGAQAPTGDSARVASDGAPAPPDSGESSGVQPVAIDAGLVKRVANALLTRLEAIAKGFISRVCRESAVPSDLAARAERASVLQKDDKALVIELSPDVAEGLGLNPRHYPIAICVGVLGLWATDLWLVAQEIRQAGIDNRKAAEARKQQEQSNSAKPPNDDIWAATK